MKNLLIVSLLATTLTACSLVPKQVVTNVDVVDRPPLVLPTPDRITARPVEWIVVTPDNVEQVFKDLQERGVSVVLFALTDDGYESLSLNTADAIKLIQQQQSVILAYKEYNEAN